MKKILILGGEGFVGRNISRVLSDSHACFSLGIEKSIFPGRKDTYIESNPYADKVEGDYDVFIHLIDNPMLGDDFMSGEENMVKNINPKKGARLMLFSSAVLYANPGSDYARRKKMFEEFYADYCEKNGINLTIFRLFNPYGAYQLPFRQGSLVANIFCNHLSQKQIEINDMGVKRDFIWARDAAVCVKYAIEHDFSGTTDIGSGHLVTLGELIGIIEEKVVKNKLNVLNKGLKEGAISPAAKNALLGKVKLTPMEEGLAETFEFYKNNISKINEYLSL